MDEKLPSPLSAIDKKSFAYKTIKERLPVILAKIADSVFRCKSSIKEEYGEAGMEDLKLIAGCASKLRNEVVTNKALLPIQDKRSDAQIWNDYLTEVTNAEGKAPSWFTSPWLYVECYMYRRVQEAVEQCNCLVGYDVFREQKEKALSDSHDAVMILFNYLMSLANDIDDGKEQDLHKLFKEFLQVSLWGNKCDLSISAGMDNSQQSCPLDQVNTLSSFIMIDNMEEIYSALRSHAPSRVDIILDNAGFEVITDLCLAEFLLLSNLATTVHFHGKTMPWFVSDVTQNDFDFTLRHMGSCNSIAFNFLLTRWEDRLANGSWKFQVHDFWTTGFPYCDMEKRCPELYTELQNSSMLIFKGDLNYRKLVGDREWPFTTPFQQSLRGFSPAPLCTLRTLKADVVTGLKEKQVDEVQQKDKSWMLDGTWAVISFCDKH